MRYDLPALMILEAPPLDGCGPRGALDDDSGDRLASRMFGPGIPRDRLLSGLDRVNLLDELGAGVSSTWPSLRAAEAAGAIVQSGILTDRVVVLAGRRVLRALRSAMPSLPDMPMGARLTWAHSEWLIIPHPFGRCRWGEDDAACRAMSSMLRGEIERAEAATRAWSTFGEDVMRAAGRGDGACLAYRIPDASLRVMSEASVTAWDAGNAIGPGHLDMALAVRALVHNLGRVLRWGGASTCSVLSHSARVGLLALAACHELGGSASEQDACLRHGAGHDLPEALPGIGDVPSPAKRWLVKCGPAFARSHVLAERLVESLCDLPPADAAVRMIVRWADLASMGVERATYFGDAPVWLGTHADVARWVADLGYTQAIRGRDDVFLPEDLLSLLAGVIPVDVATYVELELTRHLGHLRLEREIFGGPR